MSQVIYTEVLQGGSGTVNLVACQAFVSCWHTQFIDCMCVLKLSDNGYGPDWASRVALGLLCTWVLAEPQRQVHISLVRLAWTLDTGAYVVGMLIQDYA